MLSVPIQLNIHITFNFDKIEIILHVLLFIIQSTTLINSYYNIVQRLVFNYIMYSIILKYNIYHFRSNFFFPPFKFIIVVVFIFLNFCYNKLLI